MLQLLLTHGYHPFANELLKSRFAAHLPPIAHMAILRAESKTSKKAVEFLTFALDKARQIFPASTRHLYLGPIPALMERRNEQYRYQLQIKCTKRSDLQILLTQLMPQLDGCALGRKVQWSIDVDPQDIS
jgi:primosomal protein N' (replication factor Y)